MVLSTLCTDKRLEQCGGGLLCWSLVGDWMLVVASDSIALCKCELLEATTVLQISLLPGVKGVVCIVQHHVI